MGGKKMSISIDNSEEEKQNLFQLFC